MAFVHLGSTPAGHERSPQVTLRPVSPSPSPFDPSASDAEVARGVMTGMGRAAESELVTRFSRRVFLYGMRHLGDAARADDLAQDVMATTLEKLRAGDVREPERIGSFVLGMARMMSRDVQRRQRRREQIAGDASRERDDVVLQPEVVETDKLSAALAALSERERAVVVLTFQDELSAADIGRSFGLEPGNVRVIRHRAIARLADLLGVDELREETSK